MPIPWLLAAVCLAANASCAAETSVEAVRMLLPGFVVEELPVRLSNQNSLRFGPDGSLTTLGYDGRIWRLRDTDGDGLEDQAEAFWNQPTLSVPVGMAWSRSGLVVSSKGKVSVLRDRNHDGLADAEEILTSGWPPTDVASGGVDATGVTLDASGRLYFGLLVANYANPYRTRARRDLSAEDIVWLKQAGRWREPSSVTSDGDLFSLYDLQSPRGTIQRWDPQRRERTTIATGIRVPFGLAFNRHGDLFNTDQEGETWVPHGNPLDELNYIIAGANYGFPPNHPEWLPDLKSQDPVLAFPPQHQSACGLVFNEPHDPTPAHSNNIPGAPPFQPVSPGQALFGPTQWFGDLFVAGQSRGKIWRVRLAKTNTGYVGVAQTLARLSLLTVDLAISPRGDLYVACHSGPPDWGTGPSGIGRLFRIRYQDRNAPIPENAYPRSATEVRITFDRPLAPATLPAVLQGPTTLTLGEYVTAGDSFATLRPPYAVVEQQDATPRGRLEIRGARLDDEARTLVLLTDPHSLSVRYAFATTGIRALTDPARTHAVDVDYDLTQASQPWPSDRRSLSAEQLRQLVPWAPSARASSGTESRPSPKPAGDWETGRNLFFGERLQCSRCHRIREEGGSVGPDLSNLTHRDVATVLRDIREPNATLHPDYITYEARTRNGESLQGFVRSHGDTAVSLTDATGRATTLRREDLVSLTPTSFSLMPSDLLAGLSESQVRDLLTFLMWAPPHRSPASVALTPAPKPNPSSPRPRHLVLVASKQDHGPGQHDYPRWQKHWAKSLALPPEGVTTDTAWEWPSAAQFAAADALVFYCWNHDWSPHRLAQIDAFLQRDGGISLIHSAVIADQQPETLAARFGLSAQPGRTGYRHMPLTLRLNDRTHAITRGFPETLEFLDEPYWPLIGETNRVQILGTAEVDGQPRPLIWTHEPGRGRVFASILGHYTWTLEDPWLRTLLWRGILWSAGDEATRLDARARQTE